MNEPTNAKQRPADPTQLTLINSSRLQALRNTINSTGSGISPAAVSKNADHLGQEEDAETARLRKLVEQQLATILAALPAGKRCSLFKIRYGMALDEFERLPVKHAAKILKLKFAKC